MHPPKEAWTGSPAQGFPGIKKKITGSFEGLLKCSEDLWMHLQSSEL